MDKMTFSDPDKLLLCFSPTHFGVMFSTPAAFSIPYSGTAFSTPVFSTHVFSTFSTGPRLLLLAAVRFFGDAQINRQRDSLR